MTEEEKREHALRIASIELVDIEFCAVYEDEELEAATEADWSDIHDIIVSQVRVSIED